MRQDSDTAKLIWPAPDIISIASRLMELQPGDLIVTGTPEGTGPPQRGDKVAGGIGGLGGITLRIT